MRDEKPARGYHSNREIKADEKAHDAANIECLDFEPVSKGRDGDIVISERKGEIEHVAGLEPLEPVVIGRAHGLGGEFGVKPDDDTVGKMPHADWLADLCLNV